MKRIIHHILLISLLTLPTYGLQATHIVGGDIRYECLGNDEYRITLQLYRDCAPGNAGFDNPASIGFFGGGGTSIIDEFDLESVTTIPFSVDNNCASGDANVCVEVGIYKKTVTLVYNPNGYDIVYQRCCRNGTINNIYDPLIVGATITTFMSGYAQTVCNSSPEFNAYPQLGICINQDITFSSQAADPDNDELSYQFCTPYTGLSFSTPTGAPDPPPYTPVIFVDPPYSENNPLGGNPQVAIAPGTGQLSGMVNIQGQFVTTICVEEYRDGQLLSRIRRDLQFNSVDCITPSLEIFSNSPVCNGDDDGFIVVLLDNFPSSIYEYTWDNGLENGAGISFLPSTFINDLSAGTYGISITEPGNGGCEITTTAIIDEPLPVSFSTLITPASCGMDNGSISMEVNSPVSGYTYESANGQITGSGTSPTINDLPADSYSITITDSNGCNAINTAIVPGTPELDFDAAAIDVPCNSSLNGGIVLNVINGTPEYNYFWSSGPYSGSGTGTNISNLPAGLYEVTLTDSAGCTATQNTEILADENISSTIADSIICETGQVLFEAIGIDGTAPYSYEWNNGLSNDSIQYISFGDTTIYSLTITDANGCFSTEQTSITPLLIDTDGDGKPDECDICPLLENQLIGTPCDDGDTLTVNDIYTIDCICEGSPTCVDINLKVFLQGPYDTNTGLMGNELNFARSVLPGQVPANPLISPTPPGQPYNQTPWNYPGSESLNNYPVDIVDWVLISFRTGTNKNTQSAIAAGLVDQAGNVSFLGDCVLPYKEGADSAFVVVEHRNHMGVMTPEAIRFDGYILNYDFTLQDSYNDSTGVGQLQFSDGNWGMYAGDGDQSDFPSYDINGYDKTGWELNNGAFDTYHNSDFNMNGDINGDDKIIWQINNGLSSRVPK